MLRKSVLVARKYGHIWTVSAIGGLVALAVGAWFAVAFVSVYAKYSPGNNPACNVSGGGCSKGKVIGLLVFTVFGFYWLTEVIKNVIHVSISGGMLLVQALGTLLIFSSLRFMVFLFAYADAQAPDTWSLQALSNLFIWLHLLRIAPCFYHPAFETGCITRPVSD